MAEPFRFRRRVEFADTDMAGIVHFSNFFRMMEVAEHEFLRSIGFSVHGASRQGVTGWPRVRASCEYVRPLRFEDWVDIEMSVLEVRNRSVRYGFEFKRSAKSSEEPSEIVARGEMVAVHVLVDSQEGLRAEVIPQNMRDALVSRVRGNEIS